MSIKSTYRFLFPLMAMALSAGLGSCVYESVAECPELPDITEDEGKDIYLTLNIGVSEGLGDRIGTRATDPGYFFQEPERINEMLQSLRIFITSETGIIEGYRESFNNYGILSGSSFTFKLKPGEKNIYLLGNYESLPEEVKNMIENLQIGSAYPVEYMEGVVLTRNVNQSFYTDSQPIPMTESFTITLDEPKEDESLPVYVNRNLFITRIAVKYTFISLNDVDRLEVKLDNMSDRQYLMPHSTTYNPSKYEPAENINGVWGRNITGFSTPESVQLSTFELELTGKKEIVLKDETGNSKQAFIYNPIYLMESPGENFMVSVKTGNENETWFESKPLNNLPKLPRNTHVVIYMQYEAEFGFEVDLAPYRLCILEPYFGLEVKP